MKETSNSHSKENLSNWIHNHIHSGEVKKNIEKEQSFKKNRQESDDLRKRMSSDLFK